MQSSTGFLLPDEPQDEKKESAEKKTESNQEEIAKQPIQRKRIVVGTPIGQTAAEHPQVGQPEAVQKQSTPVTPTSRPTVGSPATGAQQSAQKAQPTGRPVVGTPVGKPVVGAPVAGNPVASQQATAPKPVVAAPRPTVSSKPAQAPKPTESKAEITRRNFIKGLAIVGGIIAFGVPTVELLPAYAQGSVGGSTTGIPQALVDLTTGNTMKTSSSNISSPNSWTTFVYPRTGNSNIDDDTFRQWVIVHLPKGWTAGSFGAVDPVSGDTFVALSRVCLHLWCLWSFDPGSDRGICPCHGSQYLPGGLAGSPQSDEAGLAVAGPASLQTPPNNWLAHATIKIASDGTISATGIVGQVGCGLKC